ncbi:PhzF family phenazine biosynthesis protein [Microlunatus flavus]|uniref:Phenazine biosynthesis protein PhzF family n=1 Tax=Microlunatus flavus TaxID=1036181 RepID=A0A1H9LAQ1_9ACTN|nr:PhzF family phenazine biosynthesis protein [Microlunatus flavus]SER08516.1 phenazine biosynthesis protein PhzF family [Microlunatus flavus]
MTRPFTQVDVFASELGYGNPVAVVHDAEGLDDEALQRFAAWTNLSETTFLLPPTTPGADYRVRIFTTARELPFAGHPTLGSARAWLQAGGAPADPDVVVQECGAGLVRVRRDGERLAFAAPPLLRGGPVDPEDLAEITVALRVPPDAVVDAQWGDNGPGWVMVLLDSAERVLALEPDGRAMARFPDIGVAGPHPAGGEVAYEVRAFWGAAPSEDPVTGSLNAALGGWLIGSGRAPRAYVAAQGTALGRRGRVHVESDGRDVWVGGGTVVGVTGTVALG